MIVLIQALDSKLSLETAMALYGLEHSELFWEKALDTKLLMAWNSNTIVMAFRGTASFANALADLQARPQCSICSPRGPGLLLFMRRLKSARFGSCF